MAGKRARGRGVVAALGLVLLVGGVLLGGWRYWRAPQAVDDAVDEMARVGVGCATMLEFDEAGDYFVFLEPGSAPDLADCPPVAKPGAPLAFELRPSDGVVVTRDGSVFYERGDAPSVASTSRLDISEPGRYEMLVTGGDASVVAAIGRDPQRSVDDERRAGLLTLVAGVGLGGLLLALAGMRSRRAAEVSPAVPVSMTARRPDADEWPPAPPHLPDGGAQVPVSPTQPDRPAVPAPPLPPLPERQPGNTLAPPPWAPPSTEQPVDTAAPEPVTPPRAPELTPRLPPDGGDGASA